MTTTTALSLEDAQGLAKIVGDAHEFVQVDLTLASFLIRDAIAYVAHLNPDSALIPLLNDWYELVTTFDPYDPANYDVVTTPYLAVHGQLALDMNYLELTR